MQQSSADFFVGKDDGAAYVTRPLSYRVQPYTFNASATSADKTVVAPVYVSLPNNQLLDAKVIFFNMTGRSINDRCMYVHVFRSTYAMYVQYAMHVRVYTYVLTCVRTYMNT